MRRENLLIALILALVAPPPAPAATLDRRVPIHPLRPLRAVADVAFSTYFGGGQADFIRDVALDGDGNTYVTGGTESADLVTTAGAYDRTFNGWHDVFVAKIDASGSLVWSTFLGGPNYDRAYAIEIGADGSVYVAGRAGDGFPTTAGVVQETFGGDVNPNGAYGAQDGFIARLSSDGGQLLWATYFGSDDRDFIRDIDLDGSGNVFVAQSAASRPHPHITPGAYQTDPAGGWDMVVAKISSDGTEVDYATFFGGGGDDGLGPSIRVNAAGEAVVIGTTNSTDLPTTQGAYDETFNGGWDLHVAGFNATGTDIVFSTYLGGSQGDGTETHELALDPAGDIVVATGSTSSDFPTTAGVFQETYGGSGGQGTGAGTNYPGDVVVAVLSSDGSDLLRSTFLGGRWGEGCEGVSVDGDGNVYVSGATYSDDFPVTAGAFQTALAGQADFFAAVLSADLSEVVYSTYAGGSDIDYGRTSWSRDGGFVAGGHARSSDWPLVNELQAQPGGGWDGALVKLLADPASSGLPREEPVGASRLRLTFPNPFRAATSLAFSLEGEDYVRLDILDLSGRLVVRLANGIYPAGSHVISWDGRDAGGRFVGAGLYFAKLRLSAHEETRRIVMIR